MEVCLRIWNHRRGLFIYCSVFWLFPRWSRVCVLRPGPVAVAEAQKSEGARRVFVRSSHQDATELFYPRVVSSSCIPCSSLSGITDVRGGLQAFIYSTMAKLIKLQLSVKRASHYRQTFKNLCLHGDRKLGNENAGVREPVAAAADAPESRSAEP